MLNLLKYFVICLMSVSAQAFGHGSHYELEVSSRLQEDATGQLAGVRMNWAYSAAITELLLEGEDLSADRQAQTLQVLGRRILDDLDKLHYYTSLTLNSKPLVTSAVTDYHLDLLEGRLNLNFLLPLAAAQDLAGKRLDIALADPIGGAILRYKGVSHIQLNDHWLARCATTLEAKQNVADGEPPQIVHVQCK